MDLMMGEQMDHMMDLMMGLMMDQMMDLLLMVEEKDH